MIFSRNRSLRVALVALAGVGSLILPVAAAAEEEARSKDAEVTFSVIGEVPIAADGTVRLADLSSVGVTRAQQTRLLSLGSLDTSSAAQPLAYTAYDVLARWGDNVNAPVTIRYGSSTWGYRKIVDKHNLNTAAARTTTKYPQSKVVESSSSVVYTTPVHKYSCTILSCRVVDTRTLRVVTNPTYLSDGLPKGVIKAYCEGYVRCDDWVKNAVNAG